MPYQRARFAVKHFMSYHHVFSKLDFPPPTSLGRIVGTDAVTSSTAKHLAPAALYRPDIVRRSLDFGDDGHAHSALSHDRRTERCGFVQGPATPRQLGASSCSSWLRASIACSKSSYAHWPNRHRYDRASEVRNWQDSSVCCYTAGEGLARLGHTTSKFRLSRSFFEECDTQETAKMP